MNKKKEKKRKRKEGKSSKIIQLQIEDESFILQLNLPAMARMMSKKMWWITNPWINITLYWPRDQNEVN